ncbi:MAG: MFS transporter [Acidobacteriota bacterium]|nr:MFS transporter [Acidobacteriota bacterium]
MSIATAKRPRRRRAARVARAPIPRASWLRLGACTGAAALLQLDGTLITVALPSVAHGLHVSSAATSAVLSAYFAAYAVALVPGGALVDRVGARRLALLGLALFAAGAAAGALTSGIALLIGTRVIQGLGAGLVSPAALAGAVSGFPPERRGSALGIWGASAGVSNLAGPLLGGLLTVALGWRADWWALVPLAALAAAGILAYLPPLVQEEGRGDAHAPLNAIVVTASLVAALTFAVMIGCFYLAEQYLQRVAGYSALAASSALILVALFVGAAAPLAGRLADHHGERLPAVAGFLTAALGLAVLGVPGVSLQGPLAIVLLVPVGVGLGMLFVPTSRAALNAMPQAAHGRTSALLSIGRLVGAAVGAGLAGLALSGGPSASTVHTALLFACGLCLFVGIPAASRFGSHRHAIGGEVGVPTRV